MKKIFVISTMLLMGLFVPEAKSQVATKFRSARPAVIIKKSVRAKKDHVWVDDHWKYNKRQNKNVLAKRNWNKKRRGKTLVRGRCK